MKFQVQWVLAELEVNMGYEKENLTQEEIFSFPLGGSMGIDTDDKWSKDLFPLFKDAEEEVAGSDICSPFKIIGTKKTDNDCKGDEDYCHKLLYDEIKVPAAFGISGFYDSSRGTFDANATFPPSDSEKCCLVAEEFYKGREQAKIEPYSMGLSYTSPSATQNNYSQLFIGYQMDDTSSHPYGTESPYTSSTEDQDSLTMLDSSYAGFGHEVFANIYIKYIETLETKVTFDNFDRFYVDQMLLRQDSSFQLIEITETKVTITVTNKASDNSKHEVDVYTCKTCVSALSNPYFNAASEDDESHDRPEGTLEFMDRNRYAPEGDCSDCVGEMTKYHNEKNGTYFTTSNLIGVA